MADLRVTVPNDFNFVITTSTNNPVKSEGLGSLVQVVIKTLFTTPGRDVFNPKYGGGLTAVISAATDTSKPEALRADVGFSISKTLTDIQTEQDGGLDSLAPDERLRNLTLDGLDFSNSESQWCVRIGVESEAGETASVGLRN